jgi:hypothetical protein
MATFEAQTMVDPFPAVNQLYNAQQAQWISNQQNQLAADSAQQTLADRATLRGLAPGLAANDPTALATAATLPSAGGTGTITALTGQGELGLKQQELAVKLAQIKGANAAMDSIYPGQGGSSTGTTAPQGQGGPSGTFESNLGAYEAPGGPTSENKAGYIGQFQFGSSRLADLGMYDPAPGENVNANQWTGTFDIPGFPNVKTKADFLASPGAQHAAFQAHVGSIDTAIAQTPGAAQLDANGLRAVAHLGGVEGMRKFVASQGQYNPSDSNGTSLLDYYQRFAAAGAPGLQTVFGSPHGPAGPPTQQAGTTPPPAGPTAAPGVAARTGGVDVAGPGAGTSGAAPAADLVGPRPLPSIGPGSPVVTPASLANTPVMPATPNINRLAQNQPVATVATGATTQAGPQQPLGPPPVASAPPPSPTPQLMPAASATPPQQPGGVGPNTPQGFQTARADSGQPQAPVTDAQGLTAEDNAVLARMKQGFKLTFDPNGAQQLQAELDKRQAINAKAKIDAWNAANPNIRATPTPGQDANGNPVTYMVQGNRIVGAIPQQDRPAGGSYDIAKAALTDDQPKIDAITASGQAAQSSMLRLNEMANIIPQLATGPAGDLRTKGAVWLESLGASPDTIKRWTGMDSGSLAEELIKLSIATVGAAAKSDIGSNVGIQSLHLYQDANPGMALLPEANKRMTNMARVSQQLSQDYTNGALNYFNPQQAALMKGGTSYSPISNYNQTWLQQNNPQVGAGAMGILNGDAGPKWTARLSPAQARSAIELAARIDPNVMVPTLGGAPQRAGDILSHPSAPAAQ